MPQTSTSLIRPTILSCMPHKQKTPPKQGFSNVLCDKKRQDQSLTPAALSAFSILASATSFIFTAGFAAPLPTADDLLRCWPLTVRPASDSLSALLSPIPLTRVSRSVQSLNSPF